ncbi:hypothetical protein BMF89_14905 [Arthrobacter sp. SRS-W-1-2016]|uniref:DUF3105 domain-containing protein n=1 Tax=Arthrobacter sp. SRS-W-1-2016 TaxID=1930254 RepID=UPI000991354B|nr:DUF3105 domain-containing protein [Arthrobacter sp. SRS-W-1-2016]OOP60925.1 hypothetical protein BMF89_14905 [Arthrobacter sp. SRS-W-1-2016]
MPRSKNPGRAAGKDSQEAGPAAGSNPTLKQQRAAQIEQKLAGFKREHQKNRRKRLILIISAWTVGIALVAGLVVFAVVSTLPKSPPAAIDGVQTFPGLSRNHVTGPVAYAQSPPVGGDHSAVPLNCAVYSEPVPNENAVHSLEHGAVWVTYDPQTVSGAQLDTLRKEIPSTYAILSPYSGLGTPVVASAWGVQLKAAGVDDPRVKDFITKYRSAKTAPEPGAPCSGGIDGPGKIK